MDTLTEIEAEERVRPLFPNRRSHECCWPMWGDRTPFEAKLVCGAGIQAGSKVPYCPDHLQRQRGVGSKGEQTAVRAVLAITKRGAS